jgi:hypothetical protein
MRGNIRQHARGTEAALEAEGIRERLQRGSRLTWNERPVDGAAVGCVEVVARTLPGQPLTARVVEHHDRHISGAMLGQDLAVAPDDATDVGLQLAVNRGLNAGRPELT